MLCWGTGLDERIRWVTYIDQIPASRPSLSLDEGTLRPSGCSKNAEVSAKPARSGLQSTEPCGGSSLSAGQIFRGEPILSLGRKLSPLVACQAFLRCSLRKNGQTVWGVKVRFRPLLAALQARSPLLTGRAGPESQHAWRDLCLFSFLSDSSLCPPTAEFACRKSIRCKWVAEFPRQACLSEVNATLCLRPAWGSPAAARAFICDGRQAARLGRFCLVNITDYHLSLMHD
jgi:hypothetical protein